jgi:hypothetical protein
MEGVGNSGTLEGPQLGGEPRDGDLGVFGAARCDPGLGGLLRVGGGSSDVGVDVDAEPGSPVGDFSDDGERRSERLRGRVPLGKGEAAGGLGFELVVGVGLRWGG